MTIGYKNSDEKRKDAELMYRNVANIPSYRMDSGNLIITNILMLYYVKEREYKSYWSSSNFPIGYNRKVHIEIPMFIENEVDKPPMFMTLERIAKETRANKVTRIDFDESDSPKYRETDIEQSLSLCDVYHIIGEDYKDFSPYASLSIHFEGFGLKDAPAKMVRRFTDKHGGRGKTRKY
ncbi:MAG: hypothetical protein AABY14_01715 [Nanoarchaeota archaeon]